MGVWGGEVKVGFGGVGWTVFGTVAVGLGIVVSPVILPGLELFPRGRLPFLGPFPPLMTLPGLGLRSSIVPIALGPDF